MAECAEQLHPNEYLLQPGSVPSVWCPGCGIGTVVNTFIQAVVGSKIDPAEICIVSGVGCTGKIAEYLNFRSYIATDGKVFDLAANIKLKHKNMRVVVFSNDVDFILSTKGDFAGTLKRAQDILVLYINNFIYHVFDKKKMLSTTPFVGSTADNDTESPFNIPHLAESCGSRYIARWTPLHTRRLMNSVNDALQKTGFSFIEVISPCLVYYACNGMIGKSLDRMKYFHDNSIIQHNQSTEKLDIRMQGRIIVGRFVDD